MVNDRCRDTTLCADAFHITQWATKALDDVRKGVWRDVRKIGVPSLIAHLKCCRYALLKDPENLSARQQTGLTRVAAVNKSL